MTPPIAAAPLDADEHWMAQALDLARRGIGLASPNPAVGCVIVRDEQLVGSGFHEYDRRDHAEVVALREAGERARGATAYVTLEPCSHQGRVGPCADALIAAGIGRVVVATADANPVVHGNGIGRLRNAGIEVTVGVMQQQAQRLNDAFAKHIRSGRPYVTLKVAMSLDGRIAPSAASRIPGEISWITGLESRQHVQAMRHEVDAVVTGIGTILADDPLLTDRSGLPRRRPLLRVVLDSELRLPMASKLVQSANNDVLVFCSSSSFSNDSFSGDSQKQLLELSAAGVSVRQIPPEQGKKRLPLEPILEELGRMQITSLMLEAGSKLNASFLAARLVDRLFLFYAPRFLGDEAQPAFDALPTTQPDVRKLALHRFGADFAVEGWMNDPWKS